MLRRFNIGILGLRGMLGLLLLNLRAVTALPAGVSNSIVMGLHFFLESVSVYLEELFEDVVDHIAAPERLAMR